MLLISGGNYLVTITASNSFKKYWNGKILFSEALLINILLHTPKIFIFLLDFQYVGFNTKLICPSGGWYAEEMI